MARKKGRSSPKRSAPKRSAPKRSAPKKSAPKRSAPKKSAPKINKKSKARNIKADLRDQKRSLNKIRKATDRKLNKIKKAKENKKGNRTKGATEEQTPDLSSIKDLDKYLEKYFSDEADIDPDNIKGKKWDPGKVENHVAKQWGERFANDDNFKPKRLKVNAPNTPERIKKYTDKKGDFNTERYMSDVRSQMASRAKKRGLKGDALKALQRDAPQMPKEAKPKYGGAIESLRQQFSDINYSKKIKETKSKLTKDVNSGAGKFKKTGMSILKKRSSEDGGVPLVVPENSRRKWKRGRRGFKFDESKILQNRQNSLKFSTDK